MFGILLAAAMACSTQLGFQRTGPGGYPPSDRVEVLRSAPTDVDVEELGRLEYKSATVTQDLVDRLVVQAKGLGADAIVVSAFDRGTGGERFAWYLKDRVDQLDQERTETRWVRLEVVALKYHDRSKRQPTATQG